MNDTPGPFTPPADTPVPLQQRKRGRKPKGERPAKSQKYDLQTILKATRHLKEGDEVLFEKMITACSEASAPTRERVLKALREVFG